jgi:uncharacterized protein with NRDE domain
MCTLIALHRCTPDAPLVVAANRDEYIDRPAEGPALRGGASLPWVAPRDLRAGGTWFGVNGAGLFAAVTNRPVALRDESRRSRGHVVLEALAAPSAREAARRLRCTPAGRHNPFNLLVADAEEAFVIVYEDAPSLLELRPGPHVIANADPDDRRVPKVARLFERAEAAAALPAAERLQSLAGLLRSHDGGRGPLDDACIHAGAYGTRSAALLSLGAAGEERLLYADGPPCRTPFEDYTFLLRELEAPGAGANTPRSTP